MGRLTTVVMALLGIYSVYYLGKTHLGEEAGLWGAFLLAASPLNIYHSHLVTADIPVLLFIILATHFCLSYLRDGKLSSIIRAGITLGLGIGAKYLPGVLLGTLILAHYFGKNRKLVHLAWSFVGVAAAFLFTTPYSIIDFKTFYGGFFKVTSIMLKGKEDLNFVISNPFYYLYPLAVTEIGPGWLLGGLAGGVQLVRENYRKALVLLFFPVAYFVIISSWGAKYPRYFLPLEPFLALLCGYFIVRLRSRFPEKIWLPALLAGLVVIWPLTNSFQTARDFVLPDVRIRAKAWLEYNIPADKIFIIEDHHSIPITSVYDINAELKKANSAKAKRVILSHYAKQKVYLSNWLTWTSRLYDLSLYEFADYFFVSSEYINLFNRDPNKYADFLTFYRKLAEYATLKKVFRPAATESGPTLYLYEANRFPVQDNRDLGEAVKNDIATSAYNLANEFLRLGFYPAAEKWYRAALRIAPGNVSALTNLGILYYSTKRFSLAHDWLQKALSLDPGNLYALETMAKLERLLKKTGRGSHP